MEFLDCGLSEETHPQPDVQQLHRQIQILTTERYLAEEKAERAAERIEEMKRFMQRGISDIDHDTEGLLRDAEKLKEENKILKEQVNDAQSHIFSLQPYRKELTPDEVGRVSSPIHRARGLPECS
jgi:DNA repair exonuclease SbcCD ATPase subunit